MGVVGFSVLGIEYISMWLKHLLVFLETITGYLVDLIMEERGSLAQCSRRPRINFSEWQVACTSPLDQSRGATWLGSSEFGMISMPLRTKSYWKEASLRWCVLLIRGAPPEFENLHRIEVWTLAIRLGLKRVPCYRYRDCFLQAVERTERAPNPESPPRVFFPSRLVLHFSCLSPHLPYLSSIRSSLGLSLWSHAW